MSDTKLAVESGKVDAQAGAGTKKPVQKPVWETPVLEDVSEQVMAQPYIRFT